MDSFVICETHFDILVFIALGPTPSVSLGTKIPPGCWFQYSPTKVDLWRVGATMARDEPGMGGRGKLLESQKTVSQYAAQVGKVLPGGHRTTVHPAASGVAWRREYMNAAVIEFPSICLRAQAPVI